MGTVEQGVRQAVENCLKVSPGESAVIITDRASIEIGSALGDAIERIAGPGRFFVMEDFGERPIDFPMVIAQALAWADVSVYAAHGAVGELATFRMPMLRAVEANRRLRHAHMIGITRRIMCQGMCTDYKQIQRLSRVVHEKLKNARAIRVTTRKGCDFTASFSPKIKWCISDGDIKPGQWMNLPDGEVFTCPESLDGTVVINGCLGDFFAERYASLEETPIRIHVEQGRARQESLECENERLRRDFANYVFGTDANSNRIGEFAVGTNIGLTELIYNLLQDEKFPSVHIAFGSPLPGRTGARWDSDAHLDGVIKDPTICVDGEVIMEHGRFCIG